MVPGGITKIFSEKDIFDHHISHHIIGDNLNDLINEQYLKYMMQTYFDAPESLSPAAIRMNGMGKGLIWVNGEGVGRYWMSFLSPLGKSTQIEYHIPRSFLKPKKNLLVIFEEEPNVNPELIDFVIVNRDTVCSYIGEDYTPSVRHWARKNDNVQAITDDVQLTANLKCSGTKKISAVEFASFGNPTGSCGNFTRGSCHAPVTKQVVEKVRNLNWR